MDCKRCDAPITDKRKGRMYCKGGCATECEQCVETFYDTERRPPRARFCSRACMGASWRAVPPSVRLAMMVSDEAVLHTTSCKECGTPLGYTGTAGRTRWCSRKCNDRFNTRKRRHTLRGARRVPFGAAEIFARDNNTCQICNSRLRMSKRGTMDRLAPVLDHIIPLADGGDHAPWNVQAACRRCNGTKGAGSAGSQLHIPMAVNQ